jgi:hypothetical protein
MNLFVSIITVLFQALKQNENVYQMIETLKVRSTTQADKEYSILISCPAPVNFFLLLSAPCLLSSPTKKDLNQKLLLAMYSPILLSLIAIFIAFEVVMWPFVYTKMLFHKLTMVWVYSKSFRVSRADKFANFISFVVHGPFTVIGNSFVDTYYFVRHLLLLDL